MSNKKRIFSIAALVVFAILGAASLFLGQFLTAIIFLCIVVAIALSIKADGTADESTECANGSGQMTYSTSPSLNVTEDEIPPIEHEESASVEETFSINPSCTAGNAQLIRYMLGRKVEPQVEMDSEMAEYFQDVHGIDVHTGISALVAADYLEIAPIEATLRKHTVKELLAVCKKYLITTGKKKDDIIVAMLQKIPEDILQEEFPEQYWRISDAGKAYFANFSYQSIMRQAVQYVLNFELQKLEHFLKYNFYEYDPPPIEHQQVYKPLIKMYLQQYALDFAPEQRAFLIIEILYMKRTYSLLKDYSFLFRNVPPAEQLYQQQHLLYGLRELLFHQAMAKQLKRDITYTVFTSDTENTCAECKQMEGKTFLIAEAMPGVNYPPFDFCTAGFCMCTVTFNF